MVECKRIPIIRRVPIVTHGVVYQTLISHNPDYRNATIMGQYLSLEIAREHHMDDMNRFKNIIGGNHSCIRIVDLDKIQEEKQ